MRPTDIIYVLIAVLAASLGLAPYIDGYSFKKDITHLVTALNQEQNYPVTIEVMEYHLGWMSSQAKLRIMPRDENVKKYLPQGIILEDEISHGPLVYDKIANKYVLGYATVDTNVMAPQQWQQLLADKTNAVLSHTYSIVSFNGHWQQQTQISSFMVPEIGSLNFQGYSSELSFEVEKNRIKEATAKGNLGTITLVGDANNPKQFIQQITLKPITFQYTISHLAQDVWDLKSEIKAAGIVTQLANGKTWAINDIDVKTTKGGSPNDLYNSNLQMTINKIAIPNAVVQEISTFTISISINNLSAQGITNYLNFFKEQKSFKVMSPEDTQTFFNLLAHIITPTSSFDLDMAFNTSLGGLAIKSKLLVPAVTSSPNSVKDLFANANGEVTIRVAAPLLKKISEIAYAKSASIAVPTSGQINQSNLPMAEKNQTSTQGSDVFKQQVVQLLQQGKISLPVSIQVLDMADQHLSVDAFATKIKTLVPPDMAKQLTQSYQTQQSAANKVSPVQPQVSPLLPPPVPVSAADKAQQLIDAWLKEGFIVQDNNDYVVSITLSNNEVIKINGKELNQSVPPALNGP